LGRINSTEKKNTEKPYTMNIEKHDIQGLLVRGYGKLPVSASVKLGIQNAVACRAYLRELYGRITPGDQSPDQWAIHIAFSYAGLRALELPEEVLNTFSREFKEGMTNPHRQFVLGDVGYNAPTQWQWGGTTQPEVAMVMFFYALDSSTMEEVYSKEKATWAKAKIEILYELSTHLLPDGKEHFGFKDGISQPFIKEFTKREPVGGERPIALGEFILGYLNAYQQYPDTPLVAPENDPANLLPPHPELAGQKDLGRNGSYLVVRQLHQDVAAFWQYMDQHTNESNQKGAKCPIKLAAKMVGRWPNGTPLVQSEEAALPESEINNDFGYWEEDFAGFKCPIGAHIRRANPRDWLITEKTQTDSVEMVDKHKILRRGRNYGSPLSPSMQVEDLQTAKPDGKERGLLFLAFAGDIVRQFEFIQNNWIRFQKFGGGYNESDPLLGPHRPGHPLTEDEFVVPAKPVRRRYQQLPAFTQLKGGAYLFFPSLTALQYLSVFKSADSTVAREFAKAGLNQQ
jgi:Dyp-type peroxidase family